MVLTDVKWIIILFIDDQQLVIYLSLLLLLLFDFFFLSNFKFFFLLTLTWMPFNRCSLFECIYLCVISMIWFVFIGRMYRAHQHLLHENLYGTRVHAFLFSAFLSFFAIVSCCLLKQKKNRNYYTITESEKWSKYSVIYNHQICFDALFKGLRLRWD